MSYSIATSVTIKGTEITGRCGCNNVKPFYTSDFKYDDHEMFMYDLLSGGLTIDRVNSKLATRIREAMQMVRDIHKAKYGNMQENYMYGHYSINPFSLFMIGGVYFTDKQGGKDEFLTNQADLTYTSKAYHTEKMVEYAIYKTKWDDYVEFYKLILDTFFNHINN